MTTDEPLLPHPGDRGPGRDEGVAAADPGRGAPAPEPGLGVGGEEPDAREDTGGDPGAEPVPDTPFRTPQPPDR